LNLATLSPGFPGAQNDRQQHALIALVAAVAIVAVVRWEVILVRDIWAARDVRYLTKPGWTAACLICVPIGGILYLFHGRTG
jgi:hypothetical protein